MLNKVLSGILFVILASTPVSAMEQNMPGGKWWRNPHVCQKLNLTDEERGMLDEQFVDSRRKLIKLKNSVEMEQFELENILESETLDEAAAIKQFDKLEKERAALSSERFRFLLQIRKILGFERFQKLKMFQKKSRHPKMGADKECPGRMDKMGRDPKEPSGRKENMGDDMKF